MSEVRNIDKADVVILYTDIGRGHPSYLDGILETLARSYPDLNYLVTDVFSASRGMSLAAWKFVRKLYYWGARGGMVTSIYGFFRKASGSGEGGVLAGILGRDVKRRLSGFAGPVIVAHPILAGILSSQNLVIYQHGELAVPAESMVKGCRKILAPLAQTAGEFIRAGIDRDKLVVTGQCVETDLIPLAEAAFNQRIGRLDGKAPMSAALFSSGAYPREHLRKLRLAAFSLYKAGHHVYLFTGRSKAVASEFIRYFERQGVMVRSCSGESSRLDMIPSGARRDENRKLAAIFEKLDIFVGPAHERTNWAVGLGLPFFILEPHIGSYAPLNAAMALGADVACSIDNDQKAAQLGEVIDRMRRDGRLVSMARNGFGHTELNGFERCSGIIADLAGKS